MLCSPSELDQFIATSDSLGGPGNPLCTEYWAGFTYVPSYQVDQTLDPFSEAYVAEQVSLYEELSGRKYDVQQNELTEFDIERHIAAPNPYNHPDPAALAVHLQRLSRAMIHAAPRLGEVVLDMGCGWGLSSELAAYLGLSVIAVDVNPSFVRLVRERTARGNRAIRAQVATFDTFTLSEPIDIALFYECLHHAVRPWTVVSRVAAGLRHGGRIVLAGEPINHYWWKHWGMRLDPISVYCIRKFGWFESGWSLQFIQQVFHREGLIPRVYLSNDPTLGDVVVADKRATHDVPGNRAAELFAISGGIVDDLLLIFTGPGSLALSFPTGADTAVLNFINFRGRAVQTLVTSEGAVLYQGNLPPGENAIRVAKRGPMTDVRFEIERWIPDDEMKNGDRRSLGLHLSSVSFVA